MKVFSKLISYWRVQLASFRRVRIYTTTLLGVGCDSVLGIATRYGLNGWGNRTHVGGGGGEIFFTRQDRVLRLLQPPVQWVSILFPCEKTAGA